MVSAKEEPDCSIPPAVDGLLRVHKQVVNVDPHPADSASGAVRPVVTRLLVADTQAGSLIGKQGSTIKSFQDATGCNIRILGSGAITSIVNYIRKCCFCLPMNTFSFSIYFCHKSFYLCLLWCIVPSCIFFSKRFSLVVFFFFAVLLRCFCLCVCIFY